MRHPKLTVKSLRLYSEAKLLRAQSLCKAQLQYCRIATNTRLQQRYSCYSRVLICSFTLLQLGDDIWGQDPVRCEIFVDNKCSQQAKKFKYFGCEISYESEKHIQQKLAKFFQMLGILNNIFKRNLVQKFSTPTIYNALCLPSLLYGSEIWALGKKKG